MRLLLTRPLDDAVTLARLIAARGHDPIVAPVMTVHVHPGPSPALDGVQAIVATSANGVRAFAARSAARDLPIFTVGPQTAEAARAAGFADVKSADGDAQALAAAIPEWADPKNGKLFHAAGAETAGRLRQALTARGFILESEVLYDTAAVEAMPREAAEALTAGTLDGVLLFSPRSAKIFAALAQSAGLNGTCAGIDAFCISAATASALAPLTFRRVSVAGSPNQDGMLALLAEPRM